MGWLTIFVFVASIGTVRVDAVAQCQPQFPNTAQSITVLRVDQSLPPGGPEDGESWACAYRTLDAALQRADAFPPTIQEIWVARGEYKPSIEFNANNPPHPSDVAWRTATFGVRAYLKVRGGFLGNAHPSGGETSASQADPEANVTILSGELDLTVSGRTDRVYHVLVLKDPGGFFQNNRTEIDGFTITEGNADGAQKNAVGGGVIVFPHGSTTPLISRCKFVGNRAGVGGGAAAISIHQAQFRDCLFIDNYAGGGGGSAEAGGGAIHAASGFGNELLLSKCRFENNSTESRGGAVFSEATSTKVVNCEFYANKATKGGGVYGPGNYTGCLFAGNIATSTGDAGGALHHDTGSVHLRDCTFVHNVAPNGVGGGSERGDDPDDVRAR